MDWYLIDLLVGIGFLILFGIIALSTYIYDRKQWNHGISQKSGKRWNYFDTDSDDSRCYTDGEGNYTWISWRVDK